ncbi:MAG: hypothetical protein WD044_12445 [Dongiaceae bacterium]
MFQANKPKAPPPPPRIDDSAIEAAALAERHRRALAGGRVSTLLTGGAGVTAPAPVASKTLLGA